MATIVELPSRVEFLMENAGTFSVFDKEVTSGRSPGQQAIAIALRPLMLFLALGKGSHWFDYRNLPNAKEYEGLEVASGKNAFNVYHPNILVYRMRLVRMSLGGWKDTALIGPDPERADLQKLAKTGWLYGYRVYGENGEIRDAQYSQLLNPGCQSIVILRGPLKFDAIGLYPETLEEVPLTGIIGYKRGTTIQ